MARVIDELDVIPADGRRTFGEFSGGNQQKALFGKWLLLEPRVPVLDDPTYGVDPNARETLLHVIGELADRGAAVIVISTEPEQLAGSPPCARDALRQIGEELTGEDVNEVAISLASAEIPQTRTSGLRNAPARRHQVLPGVSWSSC